jgi:hypothetical protein
VVIVATPEEMPVTETIELAGRLDAETDVDLAAWWSTGCCPSCSAEARRRSSSRCAATRRPTALSGGTGAGDVRPVLDAAELAVTPAPHPRRAPRRLRAAAADARRCSTCPYLFTRSHGARATRRSPTPSGEELGF